MLRIKRGCCRRREGSIAGERYVLQLEPHTRYPRLFLVYQSRSRSYLAVIPLQHFSRLLPQLYANTAPGETDMQICYSQPQLVPQPCAERQHHQHSASQNMSQHVSQWVSHSRSLAARASSRASVATLTRPRRSQSRPSIGRPTDFRHFGGVDGLQSMIDDAAMPVHRRRSFRPLELSIYLPDGCGRLSPLPDFEGDETWTAEPAELEMPAQALVRVRDSRTNSLSSNASTFLIQRKPVGSGSRRSSLYSQRSASFSGHERRLSGTTVATMATPTMPYVFEESNTSTKTSLDRSTPRRSQTSATFSPVRVLSRLPSPSRSRANTTPARPGSLRRARTDVEDAIARTQHDRGRAPCKRISLSDPVPVAFAPCPLHRTIHACERPLGNSFRYWICILRPCSLQVIPCTNCSWLCASRTRTNWSDLDSTIAPAPWCLDFQPRYPTRIANPHYAHPEIWSLDQALHIQSHIVFSANHPQDSGVVLSLRASCPFPSLDSRIPHHYSRTS